jgi:hypothetical protein
MHVRRSVPIYLTHLDAQWRVGPPKRHSSFGADVCHSSPFLDNLHFDDFVKIYPSQTKILEGRTNISERIFEALFKDVSTGFGRQNVEKCFENAY